jgi:hypothetical protein
MKDTGSEPMESNRERGQGSLLTVTPTEEEQSPTISLASFAYSEHN